MPSKLRFTKENTLAIKGIAICMLLCYHTFSSEDRFGGAVLDFWPFSGDWAMCVCRSMQVCVGIFLFLSVYGLTLSMKKQYPGYELNSHEAILYVVRRYLKLLSMFLIPFFACQIVTKILGLSRYGDDWVGQIGNFILDMFGVGEIFGTKLLVETWWYMGLVVMVVVFMPLLINAYKKYGWTMVLMFLVTGSMFVKEFEHLTSWLLIIPIAICFADRGILERIKGFRIVKNPVGNKILKFFLMTVLLWIMVRLRMSGWGSRNIKFAMNAVVPLLIICWSYEFIIEIPVIKPVLQFLGRHSADIYYTHSFIRGAWFQDFTYSFKYAPLIFLVLLTASLGFSCAYDCIRRIIHYAELSNNISEKVVNWCDRVL